ncbi:efflux RND transporter periplasmic adaptor subunit [Methylobacterium oryzae]|uniref:Efflux transporter periplasmic adaptor subunit n=1 Tax=Methylobacterium oryzae TaxID=334852 RepID=A0ABU7TUL4_9HYPH
MLLHRYATAPTVLATMILLGGIGCQPNEKGASSRSDTTAPPPVATATVGSIAMPLSIDMPGRLASTRVAEVRAQVSGIIQERTFEEGSIVQKGDVLFLIDPSVYKAEVDAKAAALARADATRIQAKRQAERTDTLLERQAASTAQYDIAQANLHQADADVASARAQLTRAKIDLDHATVRAPIAGRIGRALVTEGTLVGQGDATKLAVVQQIDPIYADFTQSADDPSPITARVARGAIEVRLVERNGSLHAGAGKLLFSDISVDPGTGQVSLRATFPNPQAALLPGTYVRVRAERGMKAEATIIPPQAIQRSSAGEAQAFVVGPDNKAMLRPIRTGALTEAGWVVEEGLKPGETVVVEGFQKLQSGVTVKPVAEVAPVRAEAPAHP